MRKQLDHERRRRRRLLGATVLSRLAPGAVAFTGGTIAVSGWQTRLTVTVLNVGGTSSGNDESGNITLQ